ncbi:MAG: sporulation protein [Oscillospiraceae bacterium]|nr:sporulation protein [Oscillospiraceae bacterium]
MIGAAAPAGAVCVKTQKAPYSSCGDINSIIKGIDIQSILENGGCGSDCIKDIISSPSCGGNSLGNNNSCGNNPFWNNSCGNNSCGSSGSSGNGSTGSSGSVNSGSAGSGNVQNPTWGNSFDFNQFLEYITGNSSSKPNTDVTKPNTDATKPDTSVTKPDTSTSKPNTSVTKPDTVSSVSEYEKEVVRLVNEIRVENGLNELTLNTELSDIARLKSQDMKDKGYFSHTSPTYGSPFDMMKSFGITYKTAGENIAMGYRSPESVVEGWMNSKGHRENILKASYKEIGVGYVASGNYWTQMFIG